MLSKTNSAFGGKFRKIVATGSAFAFMFGSVVTPAMAGYDGNNKYDHKKSSNDHTYRYVLVKDYDKHDKKDYGKEYDKYEKDTDRYKDYPNNNKGNHGGYNQGHNTYVYVQKAPVYYNYMDDFNRWHKDKGGWQNMKDFNSDWNDFVNWCSRNNIKWQDHRSYDQQRGDFSNWYHENMNKWKQYHVVHASNDYDRYNKWYKDRGNEWKNMRGSDTEWNDYKDWCRRNNHNWESYKNYDQERGDFNKWYNQHH